MAEQDRMETALLAAVANSTEPMVLSDARLPDMPMVAVNSAFEALSGHPRIELVGRNCRFLQGAATDPATRGRIGRCLRAGEGCIEWIVNYRKNGATFWNLLFISPVFGADGDLRYSSATSSTSPGAFRTGWARSRSAGRICRRRSRRSSTACCRASWAAPTTCSPAPARLCNASSAPRAAWRS